MVAPIFDLACARIGSAVADATEAISLEPTYIKSYYRRGTARLALQQLKLARTDFRTACNLEPTNKDARSKFNECEKVFAWPQSAPSDL